jgi:CDP-4-dehydro-6-deoxyglucose reductase
MSYKVTVKPSDHTFWVEADENILDAALRDGSAHLPYGCRNGSCGTCLGRVVSGEVFYPGRPPSIIDARDQADGKALFCQARARSDLVLDVREVDALQDIPVKTLPCRVVGKQQLAPDVMRLYLKLPATERLQYLAGQYVSFLLRDGRRRDFSLANAPHADECLEVHVRLVPGGHFTSFVFEELKEKAILRIQGPLGTFVLREESVRPIIMMGGGTGFAPLKGILEHAFYIGIKRPIHLYWGARARQDLYLGELPEAWQEKYPNFRYTPVLSEPGADDRWTGRQGFVHAAVATDYPDLSGHEVYMSGPPPMIKAARAAFAAQGLPDDHLYYDTFDYAADTLGATAS